MTGPKLLSASFAIALRVVVTVMGIAAEYGVPGLAGVGSVPSVV